VNLAAKRLVTADVYFGHGTDNAEDDALFLILHALNLSYDVTKVVLKSELTEGQIRDIDRLITARIETRKPSAYLTGYTWFCGHKFKTDERVLVPRSPIAELVIKNFHPWWEGNASSRALEIGTGGGCIAIAMALNLGHLDIDATDISSDALAVAQENAYLHSVQDRVSFYEADLFPHERHSYDLIVANPPYVPSSVYMNLPSEYHTEPVGALLSGEDGLDCVRRILNQAPRYLKKGGLLFVEVGEIWETLHANFPALDFTWVDLQYGGEGVFVLSREQLLLGNIL